MILLLGGFVLPAAVSAAKPAKQKVNTGQMRKIKVRMQRKFMLTKPSDAQIEELLKEITAEGSFPSVNYDDPTYNSGGKKKAHLTNLHTLARAYVHPNGTYYQSREVYDALMHGLNYWVTRNLEDRNWWHRIINYPKAIMLPLTLVADDMKRYDKELFQRCIDYMCYSWSIPRQRAQDGANGTDICQATFGAAILSENETLLREVMDKVNSLVKIAQKPREEGIQPDFSYSQHNGNGRQLYLATYGNVYLTGLFFFLDFTQDTPFFLSAEKIDILERFFLNGVVWTYYRGDYDLAQYGRGLLRPQAGRRGEGQTGLKNVECLISYDTPRNDSLKEIYAVMKGGKELNGNRYFPRADYMIHRPAGAMITTHMTSIRTVGNEAGNNEGMQNYHMGDGVNYIKVHGNEYEDILHAWNWKRIPGTTVIADSRPLTPPLWGENGAGGSDYAGGVTDHANGAAAFIYKKDSVDARKSWFYFDRYYVALGAGISTPREDGEVITTVNQTLRSGKVALDGSNELTDKSTAPFTNLWHYDVGYRFVEGTQPEAMITKGKHKNKSFEILRIEINHHASPRDARYAYAVYPAISEQEFAATGDEFQILSNTPAVQAVEDKASGKVMAAFYEAGAVECPRMGTIRVDKPSLVIIGQQDGKTMVSVGSPYAESRSLGEVKVSVGDKSVAVAVKDHTNTVEL